MEMRSVILMVLQHSLFSRIFIKSNCQLTLDLQLFKKILRSKTVIYFKIFISYIYLNLPT